jgi:hypothetical protein
VSLLTPSDHLVLPSLLLFLFHSSSATRKHTVGSFDGLCITGLPSRGVPSAPTLAPMVPSVHPTVSLSFFFFRDFNPWKIDYLLNLACGILASLGLRNVYKDMLNNMVSLINHVVMNHQNQTRTNVKWGHVRYSASDYPGGMLRKPSWNPWNVAMVDWQMGSHHYMLTHKYLICSRGHALLFLLQLTLYLLGISLLLFAKKTITWRRHIIIAMFR